MNENQNMKDSSNMIIEKPFTCDIDGCLMKFTNEDHLTVHKKRHDMVLNLGLGPKGNNFSDQTPTPTRFIRNCEEVGLFQDLQNVNPFEETFRRAVEAVKTGQTPVLEKSFQSSTSDDTLHTPNIFPHITDLSCVNPNEDLHEKVTEDELTKKEKDNHKEKGLIQKTDPEPKKIILGNISHKKRKAADKPIVIESSDNEKVIPDKLHSETIPLIEYNNQLNPVQEALKEKIKSNIQNRQTPLTFQLKVPIPKSTSTSRYQRNQKDKFSTFAKNSLKFESKLEKFSSSIFEVNKKRRPRKNYTGLPKERIEILERNRAAATRCREKKKIYVSYLEKCNRELTEANKKLQILNMDLRNQLSVLQAELLKHQNCIMQYNTKEETVVTSFTNIDETVMCGESEKELVNFVDNSHSQELVKLDHNEMKSSFMNSDDVGAETTVFHTEVAVSEYSENGSFVNNCHVSECDSLVKNICEEDKFRKVYTDHSYFNFPSVYDARKRNLQSSTNKPKLNFKFLTKDTGNHNRLKTRNLLQITQPGENSGFSNGKF